jgi:hypothetical protein
MREHPIPQDVVGYRFHIVGNMTIKQFAEVGAGCLLGVLINSTNLFFMIKWPLIGLSVGVGVLAAFVPFEERPLDHWIITFFRVMYKPTQFFWRREPKIPEPFLFEPDTTITPDESQVNLTPARRARIKEYLTSLDQPTLDEAAQFEANRLNNLMGLFSSIRVDEVDVTHRSTRPSLVVKPRSLKSHAASDEADNASPTDTVGLPDPEFTTQQLYEQYHHPNQEAIDKPQLEAHQVAGEIVIPDVQNITVDTPQGYETDVVTTQDVQFVDDRAYTEEQVAAQPVYAAQAATTNVNLPFPTKPTEPNKVVGMILSPQQELINDAIVEIVDQSGMVARAVKSNALGQFFITTPLPNGDYTIQVDKEGTQFLPLQLSLSGSPVDPIEIRSL